MNKVAIVKAITSAYFVFALGVSFTHLIHAAHLGGLTGHEAYSVPFMIDGMAIIGLVMRSKDFSKDAQKWGLITQATAGALSLIGNVFAAEGNIGGMIYGVAVVVLFLAAEFLSHKIRPASDDVKADQINKRQAAARKAAATRKANARKAPAKVHQLKIAK